MAAPMTSNWRNSRRSAGNEPTGRPTDKRERQVDQNTDYPNVSTSRSHPNTGPPAVVRADATQPTAEFILGVNGTNQSEARGRESPRQLTAGCAWQ
jgi:hypothetical protein